MHWAELFARQAELRLDAHLQRLSRVDVQTMLLVHALLVLSACGLAFTRRWWTTIAAMVALAGCSVVWFGVNQHWEGRVLFAFSATHGLTQADLAVPVLTGAALVVRGLLALGRRWTAT